jgi:hypothetical protein
MSYNVLSCGTNTANTGRGQCVDPFAVAHKIILVPQGTEIDTEANAKLQATWITLINESKNERGYVLPRIFRIEPAQDDPIYEAGAKGMQEFVREGKKTVKYSLENIPLCEHKKLRTLNNQRWAMFVITDNGSIRGKSIDGTKFLPVPLNLFRVENRKESDGEAMERTMVMIEWQNPNDWDDYGVYVTPTAFDPRELNGILDVTIGAASAISVAGFTFSVAGACDSVAIEGLVAGDFTLLDSTGATVSITSVTESATVAGTYVLAATLSAGTYSFNMKQQPGMTTNGYESTGAISVTLAP